MSIINLSKWVKVGGSGVLLTKKWVKAMLIGEYNPSIDLKGRLHFPARLREDLGDKFIVTKGLDNCLFVYSLSEWAELEAKIKALPMSRSRTMQRFFFAGAVEVEPDKQGRILIPANLREYAHLDKDVTVVGASVRAEIWDTAQYQALCSEVSADDVAAAMDELGF